MAVAKALKKAGKRAKRNLSGYDMAVSSGVDRATNKAVKGTKSTGKNAGRAVKSAARGLATMAVSQAQAQKNASNVRGIKRAGSAAASANAARKRVTRSSRAKKGKN